MLIGPRAASIPIQIVALVAGIVGGLVLNYAVVGVPALLLPGVFATPIQLLCVAFCAYFFAAPGTWKGLARRALLIIAISFLGYAALGYLIAFLFLKGEPVPGSMPSLVLAAQGVVAAIGFAATGGFILLREPTERPSAASATVPAQEGVLGGTSSDTPS
jgi:hypothetical protein